MDIHCSKCDEPWETYHMRHDAIMDAVDHGLTREECKNWDGKLTPEIREAMKGAGWEFGTHHLHVLRCPACKWHDEQGHPPADRGKAAQRAMLAELLGDDLDGFASMCDEFDL